MTKTRSSMKILACLMAVVAVLCSMVVSVSALEPTEDGAEYTPSLKAVIPVPHTLDFFTGTVIVTTKDGINTVRVELKPDASVTVNGVTVRGTIDGASTESEGYTAEVEGGWLIVTCSDEMTTETFGPVITFKITREDGVTHQDMPAQLILTEVNAED